MKLQFGALTSMVVLAAHVTAGTAEPEVPGPNYVPDPEIEAVIDQATQKDPAVSKKALEKLGGMGLPAERALTWHLCKEPAAAKTRYADVMARLSHGKVAYRVTLELQPDGSGTLTLWSDRALLAECGKRYARIMGEAEPVYSEDELRRNPYAKVELIRYLDDGMKFLESGMGSRSNAYEAFGLLSFKSFESLTHFSEGLNTGICFLLTGATLCDFEPGIRTYHFKKAREDDPERYRNNMLQFNNVKWEFVLDFKGRIQKTNAPKTEGTKLIWTFDCAQMLKGEAVIDASFDAAGTAPRPAPRDDQSIGLPAAIQANQPIAVVARAVIHAKTCKKPGASKGSKDDLRRQGYLIELDGRSSITRAGALQYRWVQTAGGDLEFSTETLSRDYVPIIIKQQGEYKFELTVSSDGIYSKPVEVTVQVEDDPADKPAVAKENLPAPVTPEQPKTEDRAPAVAEVKAQPKVEQPAPKTVEQPAPKVEQPTPKLEQPAPKIAEQPKAVEPPKVAEQPKTVEQPKVEQPKVEQPKVVEQPAPKEAPAPKAVEPAPKVAEQPKPAPAAPEAKTEVKADPAQCAELHKRGVTFMKAGNYKEAKAALTQAFALNAQDYECEYNLAVTLMELNELHPAVVKFEDVATNTKNPRAMMYCGHCHARAGELEEARECYRAGMAVGKDRVKWEYNWQMAYGSLMSKDYEDALSKLEQANQDAVAAKIKDYRLERDLAIALHGCKKDKEALPHLNALIEMGYTPDAQLLADVKKATGGDAPKTEAAPVVETAKKDPPAEPKVVPTPPVKPVEVAQATPNKEPVPTTTDTTAKVTPVPVAPAVSPAVQPTVQTPKETPAVAQPAAKVSTPATQPAQPKHDTTASTGTSGDSTKPVPVVSKNAKRAEARPSHPKRPLPPIPSDFDEAIAAGKRAYEEGEGNWKTNNKESRIKAEQAFDEAEAMYRSAWNQKPGDPKVVAAFKELSKHHGAIALVKNNYVKTKVNGLVVLDSSACIAPEETLYCAWEQSDGDPLPLRPEQLIPNAQKMVSIKIKTPGTYKFDLAVSDGVRGGNPVTVTVEVGE